MEVTIKVSDDRQAEDDAIIFPPLPEKNTVQCQREEGGILWQSGKTMFWGEQGSEGLENVSRWIADRPACLHQPSAAEADPGELNTLQPMQTMPERRSYLMDGLLTGSHLDRPHWPVRRSEVMSGPGLVLLGLYIFRPKAA